MIERETLLHSLPPIWPEDPMPEIAALVDAAGVKVVVFDDDPTGTQTVHDVTVLMDWSVATLQAALEDPEPVVYVLTNTRSMPLHAAQALNREIAGNLQRASAATGRPFVIVSRSDSTLRGHYPGEIAALRAALPGTFDGTLIIPFFIEGGRLTIGDTHYVTDGDSLVPAAETEYARDAVFGYRSSDLRAWVSEKHGRSVRPEDAARITLGDLRRGGPEAVTRKLRTLHDNQVCIVNAAAYRDLEVFTLGLLRAEAEGKRFLYRTAASFVRVRGGIAARPLLTGAEAAQESQGRESGGLVIAGSHVRRTTAQVAAARALAGVVAVEVSVPRLLDPAQREDEIRATIGTVAAQLRAGRDVLVYTSREVITTGSDEGNLAISQQVSSALVALVAGLPTRPAWIIAKGGITSSDIATQGLGMHQARVLGQAVPGVPIWRAGPGSRWPGIAYTVFPGNVGGADALARMVRVMRGEATGVLDWSPAQAC